MGRPLTIWEHAQLQGHSRREFLQFCAWLTAAAGIESSAVGDVVHALETKPRKPVLWFHFQECTCCSESFIRSSHHIVSDIILDKLSLDYTQTLQAAAGEQAEKCAKDVMEKHKAEYLMLCEGSVPTGADGVYCCVAGRTALDVYHKFEILYELYFLLFPYWIDVFKEWHYLGFIKIILYELFFRIVLYPVRNIHVG